MAASDNGHAKMMKLIQQMPIISLAAMEGTMAHAKDLCKNTTAFKDRTGNLRRSIDAGVVDADGNSVTGALSAGYPEHGDSDVYAGLVELGHEKPNRAAPHPYISPTMDIIIGTGVLANQIIEKLAAAL